MNIKCGVLGDGKKYLNRFDSFEIYRPRQLPTLLWFWAGPGQENHVRTVDVRSENNCFCQTAVSASLQMVAMVRTHPNGYAPLAVSPDSMTQSAPSRMALATSDDSARVARGFLIMDSSI